ncbi:MAG: hypothetical protein UMU76_05465 [Prosthecochloris sp.]|nr:hypothetical protein [Prosthecochloris sp.]
MITRQELIKRLKDDIKTEEVAVSLYTKHLKDTLQLADLSEVKRNRMAFLLERLTEDSRIHEQVMQDLLSRISNSGQDVF